MSYSWEEPDPGAFEEPPTNATCHDCGVDYSRGDHDRTVWCDECSDKRDRWTSAQEIRSMAKAILKVDLMKVTDVA